jgi:hypothetical protein
MVRLRFGTSIFQVVLLVSFSAASFAGAAEKKDPVVPMTLVLRNFAKVPTPVIETAKTQVSKIFAGIDIQVGFQDCAVDQQEGESCASDGSESGPRLNVDLEPRSFLLKLEDAMGIAQENNQTAYVFYDRIEATVREFETEPRTSTSLSLMLACIISHEVGHLLLRSKLDHRPGTIMRPTWSARDLREIEVRGVRIGADQASAMRKALSVFASRRPANFQSF